MATLNDNSEPEYLYSRPVGVHDHNYLLRDMAFNKHSLNDGEHVSPYDNSKVDIGLDNIEVRLLQGIDEAAFKSTLSRAQKATIGLPDVDLTDTGDWEEMLKGGLQTALESQVVIFEVFGVARATTHQLVRTRKAAFHQQSMRASFMGNHPDVRMPASIFRNARAREAFEIAIKATHDAYRIACEEDVSYQDARYALPIGTQTYIMCEYPLREFLAVYAYRACSMFQWEICHIVREMGRLLGEAHPWLKPYIKISCETTVGPEQYGGHKCTFQGWEDVEQGCDFPWAHYENRVFQPTVHRIRTNKEQ
ncbi:MAG TPA: FAD-dependent thymidylate synthase [Ktedonobacteraceae bacterium]